MSKLQRKMRLSNFENPLANWSKNFITKLAIAQHIIQQFLIEKKFDHIIDHKKISIPEF